MNVSRRGVHGQRGWAGLVMLLVVVLVIAFLSKDALLKYLGATATAQRGGSKTPLDPASSGAAAPAAAPANAMDRARGLQDTLQKESAKRGGD